MPGSLSDTRFAPGIMELVPDVRAVPPDSATRAPLGTPSIEPLLTSKDGLKVWEGERCADACRSPVLLNQYRRWQAARRRSGMPLLKDVYASVEEADLEDAMLLLQLGADFIYVFQGSGSVQRYGRVFRGALMSEIEGKQAQLREAYNRAISSGMPLYIQFDSDLSNNHLSWERLLLPLFGDPRGASRFLLMYSAPLDDKFEILTAVFERSPIGMIAACTANAANVSQARVLMINAHARQLLKLPREGRPFSTVHQLWTWIAEVTGWQRLSQSSVGERTKLVYVDGDKRHYVVLIEPLGRFAVLHLIEMDGGH